MAYLLRRAGKKVHTIDIPPVKDRFAIRKWDLQLELFGEAISRHTGKRIVDSSYNVKNFKMNDKCAAGTGKFMEVIAQILETTIDKVGPLSLESTAPCDINSTCVVFAQSEVISLMARKYDRRDILSGMHFSMAKRIIKMMKRSEKGGDILMTGGGSPHSQ